MKARYKQEVDKLHNLLWDAKRCMEEIPKYYNLVGSKNDVKSAGMLWTMRLLCEDDYLPVGELWDWLEYIDKPRQEYALELSRNTGRFMAGSHELTCGRHIELFV